MNAHHPHISARTWAHVIEQSLLETAWPTRCVACDKPGTLLCRSCWLNLAHIDQGQACPRCGGPYGQTQCTECNAVVLASAGIKQLPFSSCASVLVLDDAAHRIVTTYKDKGEQRLAAVMSAMMAKLVDPAWLADVQAVTFIPDSSAARRRRGFDHSQLLAMSLARRLGKSCLGLLARPHAEDQRALGRKDRMRNMAGALCANPAAKGRMPKSVILVDDVITTGATLFAASQVLAKAGVEDIRCITFARAW